MDRGERWVQLLRIVDALKRHGSWSGETHIQKSAYFLKEGLGLKLPYSFILYNYGPFSFDLEEQLGELRGVALIEICPREPYGPSLVVSNTGRHLLTTAKPPSTRFNDQVEFVAEQVGQRNVAELERICTALYVKRNYPNESEEERALRINRLKPHVSEKLARDALAEVTTILAAATKHNLVNDHSAASG